jgi:hypothetical protein
VSPAKAAGVTERLWEISDLVRVLEDSEAPQGSKPIFDVDLHKIDGKPFVRATFPDGKEETIYGFNTRADGIKWTGCEAVVWLWQKRQLVRAAKLGAQ